MKKNLTTHLPKNVNGYGMDNGQTLSGDVVDKIPLLDQLYQTSQGEVTFKLNYGGPHCLTVNIAPSTTLEKTATLSPSRSSASLFALSTHQDIPESELEKTIDQRLPTRGFKY